MTEETGGTPRHEAPPQAPMMPWAILHADLSCVILATNLGPGCLVRVIEKRPINPDPDVPMERWDYEAFSANSLYVHGMSIGSKPQGPSLVVPGPGGFGRGGPIPV